MATAKLKLKSSQFKENNGSVVNNPTNIEFNNTASNRDERLYLSFEDFDTSKANVSNIKFYAMVYENDMTLNKYEIDKAIDFISLPNLVGDPTGLTYAYKVGVYTGNNIYNNNALSRGICVKLRHSMNPIYYGRMYVNTSGREPYLEVEFTPNFSPIAKNLTLTGKDVEKDISVSWETEDPQTYYYIEVIQNGVTVYTTQAYTSVTSTIIPKNKISPDIEATIRVRINVNFHGTSVNGIGYATTTYTGSLSKPVVSNLSYLGEYWEKDIAVNWRADYQDGYEYECYYNNAKVKQGNGTTSKDFIIPANTFSGTLPASVRVRVFRNYDGVKHYSEWVEQNITLKDIVATITNLLVSSEYWEKDIELSWQSTDQEQLKIEVFKENNLIDTYTVTTATRYTIPAETLVAGSYTFKAWVGYANRFVNFATKNVALKDIAPTITDLNLSGSNIDYDLSLGWQSTDQQKYEVEVLKDSAVVDTRTGTLDKIILFEYGTLKIGAYTFKVRIGYKDRWSEWKSISTTLVETMPSIGAFEPDRVIKKKDEEIPIWWTSNNQSKWEVVIDDNLITYTGTLETERLVAPNTLSVGKHTMVLTVIYVTAKEIEKPVTKKAEFWIQGKPPIPTITSSSLFATSMPVITWDTQEQQGYLLEILQGNNLIWSTKWQNGLVTRQKVLTILKDGVYTARLKIKNQFSIESDYAIQNFTVSTSESTEILLSPDSLDKYVQLTWNNIDDTFKKFYVVRDGEVIASTQQTVYNDYTALGEQEYTIIGLNSSNVAKYSNSVLSTCSIDGCYIAPVDDLSYMFDVGKVAGNYSLKMQSTLEQEVISCTGREKPITVFGEHTNTSYTLQFVDYHLYFEFVQIAKRRKTLCYRDRRQKLFLSIGSFSYDLDSTMAEYNVPAVEVSYSEVIDFD